ncbi:LLM class flavin-dependent oxidoreductase, partial [Frankia sp. Cj5]|uniref:LLM class flavin-dependent oxidoreductase n=1 Tax=Frankia sp. Cj5 TaxID=2880978 RepID=UPI001EF49D8B
MQVGLYFDLRNPPERRQDPTRLYGFTLEMCQEAERLGADSIWVTEHHLFDDDYLPQPLTFAAAIAARTNRVRIGTG